MRRDWPKISSRKKKASSKMQRTRKGRKARKARKMTSNTTKKRTKTWKTLKRKKSTIHSILRYHPLHDLLEW